MEQRAQKKSSGCGCGTLIGVVVIIYLILQFIDGPIYDIADEQESAMQPPPTTIVTESTVTPSKSIEETITELNKEKTIEPPEEGESLQFADTFKVTSQSDELLERHFTWNYLGEWNWDVRIPKALYDYYSETPRPQTMDYSVYVTHPLDDIYIEQLVEIIQESATEKGLDEYQIVEFTIAFVQSLPYPVDSATEVDPILRTG